MPLAEHDRLPKPPHWRRQVSIHVPLAEHDHKTAPQILKARVSIHVPLAEHDLTTPSSGIASSRFNSRAPRGARRRRLSSSGQAMTFQFTCPSRSTTMSGSVSDLVKFVSIHVPLAEHDGSYESALPVVQVSIHVPLAEHDPCRRSPGSQSSSFNSRAPRGARRRSACTGS